MAQRQIQSLCDHATVHATRTQAAWQGGSYNLQALGSRLLAFSFDVYP